MRQGERHGLVGVAHGVVVTSECLLHDLGGRSAAGSEAKCHCVVLPPLCALHQLLRILQKQEEAEGGAMAIGVLIGVRSSSRGPVDLIRNRMLTENTESEVTKSGEKRCAAPIQASSRALVFPVCAVAVLF